MSDPDNEYIPSWNGRDEAGHKERVAKGCLFILCLPFAVIIIMNVYIFGMMLMGFKP